jgi:Uma2 family endonuclease
MHVSRITTAREIEYPSSDGKPRAETDLHRDWMITIIQRLANFYRGRRVYVSGNLFIYYREGEPRYCVAPDTFVVKNCKPGRRTTFMLWKEKRRPNFVLETTSKKTRSEDAGKKMKVYAEMQIPEYFLYDPTGDWLKPQRLQGYRLRDGVWEPITADAGGGIVSAELNVRFVLEEGALAMFDNATGERLLSAEEAFAKEAERADRAEQRARALEQELARLREGKKANGRRKNGR